MTRDDTVKKSPGFWMHEETGVLAPVVLQYLRGNWLSHGEVLVIRAYLRQWIAADWQGGEDVEALRRGVDEIHTSSDIDQWLERAEALAIDPF